MKRFIESVGAARSWMAMERCRRACSPASQAGKKDSITVTMAVKSEFAEVTTCKS